MTENSNTFNDRQLGFIIALGGIGHLGNIIAGKEWYNPEEFDHKPFTSTYTLSSASARGGRYMLKHCKTSSYLWSALCMNYELTFEATRVLAKNISVLGEESFLRSLEGRPDHSQYLFASLVSFSCLSNSGIDWLMSEMVAQENRRNNPV